MKQDKIFELNEALGKALEKNYNLRQTIKQLRYQLKNQPCKERVRVVEVEIFSDQARGQLRQIQVLCAAMQDEFSRRGEDLRNILAVLKKMEAKAVKSAFPETPESSTKN